MLNILGCLDGPRPGRYFLGTEDVSRMSDDALSEVRGRRIGFIFQSYNLIAQLTVLENIQVPLFTAGRISRLPETGALSWRNWWGWATGSRIGPASCRAASSSAWPYPFPGE